MRDLIQIVENASMLSESVAKVVNYLRFNGEDVDPRDAQAALNAVQFLKRSPTEIHRVMRLTDLALAQIQPGSALGIYWSTEQEIPKEHLFADSTGEWYLFTAIVKPKSIDIAGTAGARLLNQIEKGWEDESEVRLLEGSPLLLQSIQDESGNHVREDLNNTPFIA